MTHSHTALVRVLPNYHNQQADPVAAFESAVESHSPVVWLKLNENEGLVAVNSGSGGTTYDGTISGVTTLGEESDNAQIGTGYLADAATSLIRLEGTDATLQGITDFTMMAWLRNDGGGEGGTGVICTYGNISSEHFFVIRDANARKADIVVRYDGGTLARKQTNADQLPAIGELYCLIARHNATTKVSDLEYGQNGVLITPTFLTNTTGVGNMNTMSTDMVLLATLNNTLTLNGALFHFILIPTRLTDEQCAEIVELSGV